MQTQADELISALHLQPHPEGGHYREVFRSSASVQPDDGRGRRSALTTIYFLLRAGEQSRFHRIASDEVWHFYEGDPLELTWIDSEHMTLHRARLGSAGADRAPVAVVPAGCWQAACSMGAYTLVGCSVGPGFDFADFRMIDDDAEEARRLCGQFPELERFI